VGNGVFLQPAMTAEVFLAEAPHAAKVHARYAVVNKLRVL
jgi:hypothetical protein